ncbi:MAG: ABC transporter permease subunit, partial [Anaerolineae bacterium]
MTVFRYTLRRFRGQILGWGIALALLAVLLISMYDSFAGEFDQFEELLALYPSELTAFIGDITAMATPEGWVSIEFFSYMPLILGIFGVLMGSGLLVSHEESGTLDLIMAHPVSRTALFM